LLLCGGTQRTQDKDIAGYIEAMVGTDDPRAIPIALRTVADALGGMAALADKTGLSRETLYRTLSVSLVGIKEPGVFGLMAPVLDSKTGHLRMAQA
jgi:hypothetical protein